MLFPFSLKQYPLFSVFLQANGIQESVIPEFRYEVFLA